MKGRFQVESKSASSNSSVPPKLISKKLRKKPLSVGQIKQHEPDIKFFIRNFGTNFVDILKDISRAVYEEFMLDHVTFYDFKKLFQHALYSGFAYLLGEIGSSYLSKVSTGDEDHDYIFKFLMGLSIIGYSATKAVTEEKITCPRKYRRAVVSEMLAVTYLYTSIYEGTQKLLTSRVSNNTALIASLGMSTIAVPGMLSTVIKKAQDFRAKQAYKKGAQRSDRSTISSGRTPIANTYLQINHFLFPEISTLPRLFQLGLISRNVLDVKSSSQASALLKQFKNLPAFLADVVPPTTKKMLMQKDKILQDYKFNNTLETVVYFNKDKKPLLHNVPRYKLKKNDFVLCDEKYDVSSSPLSGEIYAVEKDEKKEITSHFKKVRYLYNLQQNNGENNWISAITDDVVSNEFKKVSLDAIRSRKQKGVLAETKINFNLNKERYAFLLKVMEEEGRLKTNDFEKTVVINKIIGEHKRRCVIFTILSSLVTAYFTQHLGSFWDRATLLLFNLYQTFIPFSETVLREMINNRLLKEINKRLTDVPNLEVIDALRLVDLMNALNGYYEDRFKGEPIILSDKTGTVTRPVMDVRGMWTRGMVSNVQKLIQEEKKEHVLLPRREEQLACFEVYASAYTNSEKDVELEEFYILELFKKIFANEECLKVKVLGGNYLQKEINLAGKSKIFETLHLTEICRTLGGRCTLVHEKINEHENQYYLVFCGIPKADRFKGTDLFKDYESMEVRKGVLSRDWCVARAKISEKDFKFLHPLYIDDKHEEVENYIFERHLVTGFSHFGTFIIDNRVKNGVDHFITQCAQRSLQFVIVTGDRAKSGENIAAVLYPSQSKTVHTIFPSDLLKKESLRFSYDSTVVFVGINAEILKLFAELLKINARDRPAVIFCEMTTEGKGLLAKFVRNLNYFVIANGDGTNDLSMMENAHVVFAHTSETGSYARGVKDFADLSDKQLQKIFNLDKSFYELLDIYKPSSKFMEVFTRLANAQEMPSITGLLKSSKMTMELALAMGAVNIAEMNYQHWAGVAFDITWLFTSYYMINRYADYPMDKKHLMKSSLPLQCAVASTAMSILMACFNYFNSNESTNPVSMLLLYGLFLVVFPSICSRFGVAQNDVTEMDSDSVVEDKPSERKVGLFSRCRRKPVERIEKSEKPLLMYTKGS